MIELVNAIIIISLIIIIYKYFEKSSYDVVMVKSQSNGKEYLVRNLADKQEAADLLGNIAIKLEKLVNIINTSGYEKIYDKYMKVDIDKETNSNINTSSNGKDLIQGQDGGSSQNQTLEHEMKMKLKADIARLVKNFNNGENILSESTPDAKYTSYTVNKSNMIFCMRDKKEGERIVKENILTFVSIHELGHIMNATIGHDIPFWDSFRLLLRIAIDNNLYKNVDFNSTPKDYCGIKISDSPLKK